MSKTRATVLLIVALVSSILLCSGARSTAARRWNCAGSRRGSFPPSVRRQFVFAKEFNSSFLFQVPDNWPSEGKIEFSHLWIEYKEVLISEKWVKNEWKTNENREKIWVKSKNSFLVKHFVFVRSTSCTLFFTVKFENDFNELLDFFEREQWKCLCFSQSFISPDVGLTCS